MQEKYLVFNPTSNNITLNLRPCIFDEEISELAQHKARRFVRSSVFTISIKKNQSVDLCALTGLSIEEIKSNHEFYNLVRRGRLQVIEQTYHFDVPDTCLAPVEVIPPKLDQTPVMPKFIPTVSNIPSLPVIPEVRKLDIQETEKTPIKELLVEKKTEIDEEITKITNKRGRPANKGGFFSKKD